MAKAFIVKRKAWREKRISGLSRPPGFESMRGRSLMFQSHIWHISCIHRQYVRLLPCAIGLPIVSPVNNRWECSSPSLFSNPHCTFKTGWVGAEFQRPRFFSVLQNQLVAFWNLNCCCRSKLCTAARRPAPTPDVNLEDILGQSGQWGCQPKTVVEPFCDHLNRLWIPHCVQSLDCNIPIWPKVESLLTTHWIPVYMFSLFPMHFSFQIVGSVGRH